MTMIKLQQPPPFLFLSQHHCPPRSSDAEDTGILQGNWNANSQLAVMKTGSSGVPKTILTRETDSSDTFTGDLSTLVKNENEIAVFYPAAAITATSSDTLTQTLNLSGQDGTLAGITNYDYSWALCKASMNETTGSSACEMTSLVTIGKFQFTANGDSPLNNITRITVTATAGNLYSSAVMKLKDGEFSSTQTGNITIKKQNRYFRNHLHLLLPFRSTIAFHPCYHHR